MPVSLDPDLRNSHSPPRCACPNPCTLAPIICAVTRVCQGRHFFYLTPRGACHRIELLKRLSRLPLFLILFGAFAYRLQRLGAASLWYDETVSLYLARLDLAALTRHTAGDIHPPLYYYLLHFWGRLAGWSEFSAAFLSLFFGVLLVALVYRVARDLTPPHPTPPLRAPSPLSCSPNRRGERGLGVRGEVAAFLIAVSPFNLWYSQEVRMYTLGAVLGLASVWFLARVLGPKSKVQSPQSLVPRVASRDFVAYVVVSAIGLYTLYYFVFLLAFENLIVLLGLIRESIIEKRKLELRVTNYEHLPLRAVQGLRTWLLSQLAIAVLYLPWALIAFRQATDPPVPPWRSFIPLPNALLEAFSALALGQSMDPREVWWVLVLMAVVIGIALLPDRRRLTADRSSLHASRFTLHVSPTFLFAYTFLPLALIYALSLWKPLYHVRYIFIYSPAFYILLAVGLWRIANSRWRAANLEFRILNYELRITSDVLRTTQYALLATLTLASFSSALNFWFSPRYADDDLRGAVHYLAEHWRPGDAILINAGYTYPAFLYYSELPIAWRGRLTEYAIRNAHDSAIVLQTGSIGGAPNLGWNSPASDFYATTADETRAALDRVFAAHPRVWMLRLYDTVVDPDGIIRAYLAQRGRILDDAVFSGESHARVQGYLTTRAALTTLPTTATRREVVLGNRIVLSGFEAGATTVRAGAPLDFTLYWQAREPLDVDARAHIALLAEDGRVVAASEETPVGNALGTSRWTSGEVYREPARIKIPADLAPGNYQLRIALFDPFTREAYSVEPNEFVVEKTQIRLFDVRVP